MSSLWFVLVIPSYLLGAIPTALLICRWRAGVDVRQYGSGNVGATNTLRTVGLSASATVFAADVVKGLVPTAIAWGLSGSIAVATACALAAVAGHNWSVFIRFSGGKGVCTSLGGLYVLAPQVALAVTVVAIILVVSTRFVSLGSIVGAILTPIISLFLVSQGAPAESLVYSLAIGILIIIQHRPNIERLLAGKEHRLGEKVKVVKPQ
ncbi:MAG: glycerol-3-phosphate 1-O-acyltransferase PlsY [Dehalococcoidales bacterium]|nr:glycerol-3-phosphate 1-O-acyltransferase PlsY [Dehalococcoidales bacterium]